MAADTDTIVHPTTGQAIAFLRFVADNDLHDRLHGHLERHGVGAIPLPRSLIDHVMTFVAGTLSDPDSRVTDPEPPTQIIEDCGCTARPPGGVPGTPVPPTEDPGPFN